MAKNIFTQNSRMFTLFYFRCTHSFMVLMRKSFDSKRTSKNKKELVAYNIAHVHIARSIKVFVLIRQMGF